MIIDTTENVQHYVADYKAAGVSGIIRYDCRPPGGGWKRLQPDEAKAIGDAGLELGVVYESAGNHAEYFSYSMGMADATYTRARAASRGQPDGACVYFAVDYDASPDDVLHRIIPYFTAVNRAFGGDGPRLRIGAYASGYVCGILKAHGLIVLSWITCSTGFRGSSMAISSGNYDLWQKRCDVKFIGRDGDTNVSKGTDWGQYVPFTGTTTPSEPAAAVMAFAAPIFQPPVFWQGMASWYADGSNASGMPAHNATDMTVAHPFLPFGTKVKITRQDTGASTVATVEDRGPAKHTGRIIDLRPAPAIALGFIPHWPISESYGIGVAPVNVEECE
jgi:hypothetical protein